MSNLTSSLTIKLIDDVSKPAKSVAQALKEAEANAKAMAKSMAGSGASDKFVRDLGKLKLSAKDIESVKKAWGDYATSARLAADSTKWTRGQAAEVRQWERQTVAALRNVGREQAAFSRAQSAALAGRNRPNRYVGAAAGAIAGTVAAHRVGELGRDALSAGADRQHVRVAAANAGISAEERGRIEASAIQAKKNAPNMSISEIMELHKEARSAVQHPEEVFHILPSLTKAASILKGMGADNANIADLVKGGESLGLMNDPHRFEKFLEGQVKAMNVMGKTITTEQIYEAAKYSKSAGATLSDDFLNTVLPSLIQEMHGSSAGDALAMLTKTLRGGMQNKHLPVERLNSLGLLADPTKIRRSKTGSIKGYAGKVVGDDLLSTDPSKWFTEVFKPAAEKAGYKTLADQIKLLNETLPSTAANLGRIFLQQEETLKQHRRNYEAAPGLDKGVENQRGDPKANVGALKKALDDLEAALTGPIMPTIAAGMDKLATSIGDLAKAAGESPNFSATAAALTALGTAGVALNAAPWVASTIGMTGLATVLGTVAASVTPVIAGLGVLAVAIGALKAVDDASKNKVTPQDIENAGFNADGTPKKKSQRPWIIRKILGDKKDDFDPVAYAERHRVQAQEEAANSVWYPNAPTPPTRPSGIGQAAPKVETGDLEKAKSEAEKTKEAVEGLNTTVTPNVDQGPIKAASASVDELIAKLRQVGSLAAAAQGSANAAVNTLGKAQRARFGFGGVQGE